jgi:hypothetical protein
MNNIKKNTNNKGNKKELLRCNAFDGAPGGDAGSISYQPGAWGATASSPLVSQNPDNFYGRFADKNKADDKSIDQNDSTRKETPPDSGSLDRDVDAIYSKKETPTPDDVVTGFKYELGHMIKKDRLKAKQLVLQNLQKDPKFYTDLHMLNIDDDTMMDNIRELLRPVNESGPIKRSSDPEQTNPIKCAVCGKRIDFDKDEVYKNKRGSSYVCKNHTGENPMTEIKQHPNDAPQKTKVDVNENETKKIFKEMANDRDHKYVVNSGIVDVMKEMWEAKKQRNAWKNQ